jgi:hypothetical protein
MSQGVLGFKYERGERETGLTALGGLPLYLELAAVSNGNDTMDPIVSVPCEDVTLLRMPVNLIDAGDANSFAVPSRQDEDYGLKKLEWAKKDG